MAKGTTGAVGSFNYQERKAYSTTAMTGKKKSPSGCSWSQVFPVRRKTSVVKSKGDYDHLKDLRKPKKGGTLLNPVTPDQGVDVVFKAPFPRIPAVKMGAIGVDDIKTYGKGGAVPGQNNAERQKKKITQI